MGELDSAYDNLVQFDLDMKEYGEADCLCCLQNYLLLLLLPLLLLDSLVLNIDASAICSGLMSQYRIV